MREIKFPKENKWGDFKEIIEQVVQGNHKFIYRGQAKDSWSLKTTFHRAAARSDVTVSQYLNPILPLANNKVAAHLNQEYDLNKTPELYSFLSLLRQHDFPTPLLDWTYSPYVAAYFAFREVDPENLQTDNVTIHILDPEQLIPTKPEDMHLNSRDNFISLIHPLALFNPRAVAQQGVYTITNVKDVGKYLSKLQKGANGLLFKEVSIDVHERHIALRDLNLMGINEEILFPDLDGLCRAMKNDFFPVESYGKTPRERNAEFKKILEQITEKNKAIRKKLSE